MLGGVVSNTSAETIEREILITDATGTASVGNYGKRSLCMCYQFSTIVRKSRIDNCLDDGDVV